MSDITAFLIAAVVARWLGAPLWVWVTFATLAAFCLLAELGSGD